MNFKPLLVAITLGVTGGVATVMNQQQPQVDPFFVSEAESEPMEVVKVDFNTDTVIAEYPSVMDVEIITNIPESEVISSMMLQQPVEGVIFRPK